jgi:Restriction endonuclease BglII
MNTKQLKKLQRKGFDVLFVSHAQAILTGDFPSALSELEDILDSVKLPITEIIGSGGGETKFTQRLRKLLADQDWKKHIFQISKVIDGVQKESISHEVDHVKAFSEGMKIALEIEWNNKDPFFDRDLENFKRLHAEGAISVGVIITRGQSLQNALLTNVLEFAASRKISNFEDLDKNGVVPTPKQKNNIRQRTERSKDPIPFVEAWAGNFVSNKFGQATTHWEKLIHRVDRGVGNPCPLLLIGLPDSIIDMDSGIVEQLDDEEKAS